MSKPINQELCKELRTMQLFLDKLPLTHEVCRELGAMLPSEMASTECGPNVPTIQIDWIEDNPQRRETRGREILAQHDEILQTWKDTIAKLTQGEQEDD